LTGPVRLAIDLGTSHTVAVVRRDGQAPRALLFDGSPVMPSGVFASRDGALYVGRDAERLAQVEPERFEPHPKRRVDDGTVLLGGAEVSTTALLAAILRRVAHEAWQAGIDAAGATVLTYPADWGQQRRGVLKAAARVAGIGDVTLVDEPVAAATYCVDVLRQQVPVGRSLAVFDFGGGTLDLAVVRREPEGLRVLATGGLDDLGGLDVDAALVGHLGHVVELRDPATWERMTNPGDTVDLRERRTFWADVRAAKEMLSRASSAPVQLPRVPEAIHLTREELERVAGPLVDRAIDETRRLLQRSGIGRAELAGVFLVGGSSRIPLVASRLHAKLGVAPTVPEQPELPVAYGALLVAAHAVVTPPSTGDEPAREEWGAAPGGPAVPPPQPPLPPPPQPARRPRRSALVAGAVAAVVVPALVGLGLWLGGSRSPGGTAGGGTPTAGATAAGPSATARPRTAPTGLVVCGDLFCPAEPTCWGGLVIISGIGQPQDRPQCTEPHYWETFVAAPLPADAQGKRQDKLMDLADVASICSAEALARRSRNPAETRGWQREPWPVKQDDGTWILHCLGGPGEGELTGSKFRSGP
jgi:actin-like ATPase involved in cell morphogenesis